MNVIFRRVLWQILPKRYLIPHLISTKAHTVNMKACFGSANKQKMIKCPKLASLQNTTLTYHVVEVFNSVLKIQLCYHVNFFFDQPRDLQAIRGLLTASIQHKNIAETIIKLCNFLRKYKTTMIVGGNVIVCNQSQGTLLHLPCILSTIF